MIMRAKTLKRADDERLNQAYDRWANVIMAHDIHNRFELFYDFLNISRNWQSPGSFEFDEEGERRMHMLLGPHTETVIRAWFILQNYKWK